MIDQPVRPRHLVAASLAIGGALILAFPTHGRTILQIMIAAAAAAVALHTLAIHVPPTGWMSPFTWMSPFGASRHRRNPRRESEGLDSIRSKLTGWRRRMKGGPPIPPEIQSLLRPLIRSALEQQAGGEPGSESRSSLLSPLTRAVLDTNVARESHWIDSYLPNGLETAELVHRVLDDIDRLTGGGDAHGRQGDDAP